MGASSSVPEWRVHISEEEWRDLVTRLRWAIRHDETAPTGHMLLEVRGAQRTWVAYDGEQLGVLRAEGSACRGPDGEDQLDVLVHSRLLRRSQLEDATLIVRGHPGQRELELVTSGMVTRIDEPTGEFPQWRSIVALADGPCVCVDVDTLREAVIVAANPPLGIDSADEVCHTWLHGTNGVVRMHTPWLDYSDSEVDVESEDVVPDTPPALMEVHRLQTLIHAVEGLPWPVTLSLPATPLSPLRLSTDTVDAVLLPTDRWGRERDRVENALADVVGAESGAIRPDDDGDYPVTVGDDTVWVGLITDRPPTIVRVWSVITTGIDADPRLFEEINAINASDPRVKLVWSRGVMTAEAHLLASQCEPHELNNALDLVHAALVRYRVMLEAFFSPAPPGDALF